MKKRVKIKLVKSKNRAIYLARYLVYSAKLFVWKIKHKPKWKKTARISAITFICLIISFAGFLGIKKIISIPRAPKIKIAKSDSPYIYTAKAKEFEVSLGDKKTNTPKIEFSVAENKITFTPASGREKINEPTIEGKTLTFREVYPKVDYQYETTPKGIKEEIIIKQPTIIKQFPFYLEFEGVTPKYIAENLAGGVFYDEENNYLFHFEKPFAYDSAGAQTEDVQLLVKRDIETKKYVAIIGLDQDWANSPERKYPIYIDPTVVHDETSEFATGQFNRTKDTGSDSSPNLTTYYQELPADEHTVALWHLDETSENTCSGGEDACDSSGTANHGTASAPTIDQSNQLLGAAARSFDGTDDYIQVTQNSTINFDDQDFSISLWFNANTSQESENVNLVDRQHVSGYRLQWESAGKVEFSLANDSSTQLRCWSDENGKTLSSQTWYHATMTYSYSEGTMRGYIDGEEVCNEPVANTGAMTTYNLLVGSYAGDTTSENFGGLIDELRIDNVARNPEEIKLAAQRRPYSIYTSDSINLGSDVYSLDSLEWTELGVQTGDGETVSSSTNLVSQWNFNETSGTAANNDAEGTSCGGTPANCDGTLTGFSNTTGQDVAAGSGWTSDNRRWGAGGLMFNGSSDYVSITDNSALAPSSQMSIETWFKYDPSSINGRAILNRRTSGNVGGYTLELSANNGITFYIYTSAWQSVYTGDNSLNPGQWYHVTGTYDGSSLKIYVNGRLIQETTGVTGSINNPVAPSVWIGRNIATTTIYFDGNIDSTRIYSNALSATEILANHNSGQIEFQTRTSADGSTWEAWKPTTSETQVVAFDSATSTNWDRDPETDPSGDVIKFTSTNSNEANSYSYWKTLSGSSQTVATGDTLEYDAFTQNNISNTYGIDLKYTDTSYARSSGWTDQNGSGCHASSASFAYNRWYHRECTITSTDNGKTIDFIDLVNENDTNTPIASFYDNVVLRNSSGNLKAVFYTEDSTDFNTLDFESNTANTTNTVVTSTHQPNPLETSNDTNIKIEGTGSYKSKIGVPKVTPDTVALWHLDETSGTGAYLKDSSGNANDGTPTGTTVVNGIAEKARSFNGTSDYIYGSTSMSIPTGDFTYEAWIKPDTTNDEMIFMASDGTGANEFYIFLSSTNKILVTTNSGLRLTTTNTVNTEWQHIAVTRKGSHIKAYINGIADPSTGSDGAAMNFGACGLLIGTDADSGCNGGLANWFDGVIDEVRVNNTARSVEEIAEAYRMGRDHRISRTITSTDFSTKGKLPFYIAADKPGTYLEATVGESTYANYEVDANTVGLWHLDENNKETPRSCYDWKLAGATTNGVYTIDPDGAGGSAPIQAYCNMTYDGGGWTMVVKSWYGSGMIGNSSAVGAVADATTRKGNPYKLSDMNIRNIIGPTNNFDIMADQNGYNSLYSTGNYEFVVIRNYTGVWTYEQIVPASTTTTVFQSYRASDQALAWTGNLQCGYNPGPGVGGINCYTVITNNPQGGAGCTINMGTASNVNWHHFFMNQWNDNTYLYICNGAQHSSGQDMNHRFWIRERSPVNGKVIDSAGNNNINAPNLITATGGTITSANGYTIHTFTSNGTFTVTNGSGNVEALVVAGGGGGANTGSGGGGGGFVSNGAVPVTTTGYSVTVGTGGSGGLTTAAPGVKGNNSVFSTITAEGGGQGVSHGAGNGGNGGSGGGGPIHLTIQRYGGTGSQGYAGGDGYLVGGWAGNSGGGGGAGAVGAAGGNTAGTGNGGIGRIIGISGSAVRYSGGGGGGEVHGSFVGAGGDGGGGNANMSAAGSNGTDGLGGGGGGGSYAGTYFNGGDGGNGIVIIRYPNSSYINDFGGVTIGTTPTQGKTGKARDFNGTSDYIRIPYNSTLNITTAITLEAWIKTTQTTTGDIVGRIAEGTPWPGYILGVGFSTPGVPNCWVGDAAGSYVYGASAVNDGAWHHIACTYSGTTVTVYIDGVAGTSATRTNGLNETSAPLGIGHLPNVAGRFFNGQIDEVRVSSIARTANEIRQAYEIGTRTHPITIDFAASLDSGNLIAGSGDTSFTVDATSYGFGSMGSNLYKEDKIIVKENVGGTEYIAQGDVTTITASTGAATVDAWDTGSTFPTGGYTVNASVFKWQREYWDITQPLDSQINAITNLTLRVTNGNEGRTIWLDDLKSSGDYLTDESGSTITSTVQDYFQYRAILSSTDTNVAPSLTSVTLNYTENFAPGAPTINASYLPDKLKAVDTTPEIRFAATDTEADDLSYQVQWDTDSSFPSPSSAVSDTDPGFSNITTPADNDPFNSGDTISYVFQSALTTDTTYFYKIRAKDPGGTNTYGSWSSIRSFTIDTSLTGGNSWFETHADQFTTDTLTGNAQVDDSGNYIKVSATTGTATSTAITAANINSSPSTWGHMAFTDDETFGDIKYKVYYDVTGTPTIIPDVDLTGNSTGFDTSPIDLSSLSTTTYPILYAYADLTYSGGSPQLQDWTISFNLKPNSPTLNSPSNGALTSTTPDLKLTATDTDSDNLKYKIELDTVDTFDSGSLQTFNQTSSQTGWSGQDAETGTAYASGTQATYTIQSALTKGQTYYWRGYAVDENGSAVWSTYSSTGNFDVNQNPTAPTSLLAEGLTNPTNVSDTTPEFSALCNDPDTGQVLDKYQIQVDDDSDFSSTLWDSGSSGTAMTDCTAGNRSQDIIYGESALILDGTTYYWRIKFWDDLSFEGVWSTEGATFAMATHLTPSNCTIQENPEDSSLTLSWIDNSTLETQYRIERNVSAAGFLFLINKAADSQSHEDTDISQGNTYQYRVRAENGTNTDWCTTGTLTLSAGTFELEGLNFQGVNIQ
jgi:hypothetical protein